MTQNSLAPIFFEGFLLQASLILALGAQNIFVLNAGLKKQNHIVVAFVSTLCDALLIFVGVLGVATLFVQAPNLKISLGVLGILFLLYYGFIKIKESKSSLVQNKDLNLPVTIKQTILLSMGFSLLNPHVYLDTIVLIGGYSTQFLDIKNRLYFGLGASVFSLIWFFGLATLASLSSQVLQNERIMSKISLVSGLILIILALKLAYDVSSWL